MWVRPAGGGRVKMRLTAVERARVSELCAVLLDQLADLAAPPVVDPLEQVAGGRVGREPTDPALARLFPAAYRDDPAAAEEYRRFTQEELRLDKERGVRTLLAELTGSEPGATLVLAPEQVESWLAALNDLRLFLGTRLEVTEEDPREVLGRLGPGDPAVGALVLYYWLGELQETLLWALQR